MTMISSRFIASTGGGVDPHPNHVPDKPEILSPPDGAEEVPQVLQIQGSEYHHHYGAGMYGRQIQICSSDNFAAEDIVYEAEELSRSTLFQIPLDENDAPYLEQGTEYFVRIRYQDYDLRWSPWSETSCFHTMAVFPEILLATPIMVTPVNGSALPPVNPVLAMSSPKTLIGTADFDKADWQIASDMAFETLLYDASDTDSLTLRLTEDLDLSGNGTDFFARGRQKTTRGDATPWAAPARFRLRPKYDDPVFGMRRIFSKKYGQPFIWQIDREGVKVNIPKSYFDRHPLYAFTEQTITVTDGFDSSVAFIPPCWIKYSVYDNDDEDMVIDLWFSPTPQDGEGWILHPAFANDVDGFYHGKYLASEHVISYSSYPQSAYGRTASDDISMIDTLRSRFDSKWRIWTLYERRLLLDLMMAEHATFNASRIHAGTSKNNDSASFSWRGFYGLVANSTSYLDGFGNIASQPADGEALTTLTLTTPSGDNTIALDVSILRKSSGVYVTDIKRGYNDFLGFDIALLGIASDTELYASQTNNPFGTSAKVITNLEAKPMTYYDTYSGLFAFVPYGFYRGSGVFRISRSL